RCDLQRILDRLASIRQQSIVLSFHAACSAQTDFDLRQDGVRVFATGIVRGRHDEITAPDCGFTHQRSLRPVAISAAAKYHEDTPFGDLSCGLKNANESIVG